MSAAVCLHGDVLAAVCLVAPLARVHPSPGADYGDRVRDAADQIDAGLPR